jgi:DNA-binding PadR family transcriptional regulator
VLGLLSFGRDLTGYDLKRWADNGLGYFFWSPAMSNIYRELSRLEELGYVASLRFPADDKRQRRVFQITQAGLLALAEWVASEPTDGLMLKDHALLRVWMGHVARPSQLIALCESQVAEARRTLEDAQRSMATAAARSGEGDEFSYAFLVERLCVRYYENRVSSFTELAESLRAMKESPE